MPRGVYERKPKIKTEDTVAENQNEPTPDEDATMDDQTPVDGELCGQCWAAGWPENGDAAECSHGTWTR